MTIDRLLARLASLEQENARLRAAPFPRRAEPGTPFSPPNVPLAVLVGAAATEVGESREATSRN